MRRMLFFDLLRNIYSMLCCSWALTSDIGDLLYF